MYTVNQKPQTNNRSRRKLIPKGIVVHSTATPGATDENESAYMDRTTVKASAHAFIDWDSITQKIPVNEIAWHAGPTANSRYIGIELCEPKDSDPDRVRKFNEVWNRAVWYFAWLLINYVKVTKVTPDVILSHDECSKRFKDTTHTDPVGYFKKYGKTVDMFRADVQTEINRQLKGGK